MIKKIEYRATTFTQERGRQYFCAGAAILISLFGLYIYFVAGSVFNVLARKSIETKMTSLTADIGNMEHEYLTKNGTIDAAFASEHGFVVASKVDFVSRNTAVGLAPSTGHAF